LPVRSGGGGARQAMAAPIALGEAAAICRPRQARPPRLARPSLNAADWRLSEISGVQSGIKRLCLGIFSTELRPGLAVALSNGPSPGMAAEYQSMLRILIADDHEIVRSGLRRILEAQANWEVVAEASDGKDAISKAAETKPDVAVLDYAMPLINGVEATRQIRARLPKTEVLIFTMHDNETLIQELLGAGARGYVLKSDAKRQLLGAIESLALHKPFFTAKVSDSLLESFLARSAREGSTLSNRERGVVQLIAEGHTNKEIANILNISLKTVETHRATVMRKLNLSSAAGLVRYAIRNSLVEA